MQGCIAFCQPLLVTLSVNLPVNAPLVNIPPSTAGRRDDGPKHVDLGPCGRMNLVEKRPAILELDWPVSTLLLLIFSQPGSSAQRSFEGLDFLVAYMDPRRRTE